MFMNLLFTSTQDQIDRFFNVEDGLVTRFLGMPDWEPNIRQVHTVEAYAQKG